MECYCVVGLQASGVVVTTIIPESCAHLAVEDGWIVIGRDSEMPTPSKPVILRTGTQRRRWVPYTTNTWRRDARRELDEDRL